MSAYYLRKDGKTFGPCSQEDLRTYLLYGSVLPEDEVRREGESQFQRLGQLPEFELRWSWRWPWHRARAAPSAAPIRYRDYPAVPPLRRSGPTLRAMLLGLLLFPSKLWRAVYRVWRHDIWGRRRDAQGFLKPWPPFMRWVALLLLLLQMLWFLFLVDALLRHGPAALQTLLRWIYLGA